jgi:monofunctional biosynthetic peptidoglycan transglycosylase
VNKAPPPVARKRRPLPGEEYETAKPLPPIENLVQELPPASTEPLNVPEPVPSEPTNTPGTALPPEEPEQPANDL